MSPATRTAVRNFQRRYGLPATGYVGPDTQQALVATTSSDSGMQIDPGVDMTGAAAIQGTDASGAAGGMVVGATPQDPPAADADARELLEEYGFPSGEFNLESEFENWETGLSPGADDPGENLQLTDILINPPRRPDSYGKASSFRNPATTTDRCTGGVAKTCPTLPGLEEVSQVSGIGFEYIGGWSGKNNKQFYGITRTSSGKWIVVEQNRLKNRVHKLLPRASDGLATFIANMKAVNLPVEAILTMGSVYCRCISNTTILSNHSYGDAVDIGGLRFVGGREVLVANSGDAADRKLLHRANACLRLSFATVLDYHDPQRHWDHFHCDTNILNGGERRWDVAWPFVRESLGLSPKGGWDKLTANALRQFAGVDAVKDKPTLNRTISRLFMREANRV